MTMSKSQILLFCTLFYAPWLFAAKVQVVGTGEAISEPDQVSFSVNIQARCYPTLLEASNAADKLAEALFNQLNTLFPQKDKINQIATHGGYTQPYYPPTHRDTPSPCQNTFQKTTQIVITSTRLSDFEKQFNEVQNLVYNTYSAANDGNVSEASAFVTLSQPTPALSFDKSLQLEMSALDAALENAKEKAEKLVANESAANLKLIEMHETLPQTQPIPMLRMESARFASSDSSAPIAFEQSRLEKQIEAIFEYSH